MDIVLPLGLFVACIQFPHLLMELSGAFIFKHTFTKFIT
jgi:hypothetical protein